MQNLMVLCLSLHEQGLWHQFAIFLEEGEQLRRFFHIVNANTKKSIFNENTPEIGILKIYGAHTSVQFPPMDNQKNL